MCQGESADFCFVIRTGTCEVYVATYQPDGVQPDGQPPAAAVAAADVSANTAATPKGEVVAAAASIPCSPPRSPGSPRSPSSSLSPIQRMRSAGRRIMMCALALTPSHHVAPRFTSLKLNSHHVAPRAWPPPP